MASAPRFCAPFIPTLFREGSVSFQIDGRLMTGMRVTVNLGCRGKIHKARGHCSAALCHKARSPFWSSVVCNQWRGGGRAAPQPSLRHVPARHGRALRAERGRARTSPIRCTRLRFVSGATPSYALGLRSSGRRAKRGAKGLVIDRSRRALALERCSPTQGLGMEFR